MSLPLPRFSSWRAIINSPGLRTMSGPQQPTEDIIGQILAPFASVFNYVVGDLIGGSLKSFATKVWGAITGSVIFLVNFNWNISDEDLMARFKAAEIAWWGQLGSTIGTALGWVTCGLLPSAFIFTFNRALAAHILTNVGEEAYDEMISELAALVQMGARNTANKWITDLFIGFRWLVKNAARGENPNTLMGELVQRYLNDMPQLKEAAKKWGDQGSKPWILSQKIEEAIDNLPIEQKYKTFLEEMLEQFGDSCIEAGYVVAGGIDEFLANQSLANDAEEGEPNTIVITPNRAAPDERYILHGTTDQLRSTITQTLANYEMVNNRDMGFDLGEQLIQKVHKQITEYVITLYLKGRQKPPYGDAQQAQITINSGDKTKFDDFNKVIRALGGGGDQGNFGYNYGNFICIAQMSDGSELKAWADTRDGAIKRVEDVKELSTAEILTLNVTEQIKDYQRRKIDGLSREIVKVYPWKMVITRKTKVYDDYDKSYTDQVLPDGTIKKATKQGYYKEKNYELFLWQGNEPNNWNEVIKEITSFVPPVTP